LVYLYATNRDDQYTYIEAAREKGYDVLLFDGQLDIHSANQLEQKLEKSRFVRVDSDVITKLIQKDDEKTSSFNADEKNELTTLFRTITPKTANYLVDFEDLGENSKPIVITQSEFMRRMKDMGSMSGMSFYGQLPDTYNLVVNAQHPLVKKVLTNEKEALGVAVAEIKTKVEPLSAEKATLVAEKQGKKDEEVPQATKDRIEELEKQITELNNQKDQKIEDYAKTDKLAKQLVDLALLANNMLKGEELNTFVTRSIELIK
jgi:molecular chaperone HtpG